MTEEEKHIIMHSLGFSHKPREHRNRYCTDPESEEGKTIAGLIKQGLMEDMGDGGGIFGGCHMYRVTDLGRAIFE